MNAFLELDRVSKRYFVGRRRALLGQAQEELWALRDVSLRLEPGESLGLIGHNGAGKTTVLRLLAGITRQTAGQVRTRGRIASLINLGAGFHTELTGRENIYLNGVILGLSRAEVRARFEQIVEFADLGMYIDTPLKRYSSGMYARLGFAVAAHVDPDVLLVDEVLSVGDVAFQDRSLRKMLGFRDSGQSILFVSHNLSAVELMCQRTIWLDRGHIRRVGPTAEVVRAYIDAVDEALVVEGHAATITRSSRSDPSLAVTICGAGGEPSSEFEFGQPLAVRVEYVAQQDLDQVQCSVTVRGDYGPLFTATTQRFPLWRKGPRSLECRFEALPLLPGLYRVEVQLRHAASRHAQTTEAAFRVVTDLKEFGSDSLVGATKSRGGFLAVAYDWLVRTTAGEHVLPGLRLPTNMAPSRRL